MNPSSSAKDEQAYSVTEADIQEIFQMFRGSGCRSLEVRIGTTRLSLRAPAANVDGEVEESCPFEEIPAPSVGLFYFKGSPASRIEEGQLLTDGAIIGTIHSLENQVEVKAGQRGEMLRALVRDGEFVEYGQPLISVRRGLPSGSARNDPR